MSRKPWDNQQPSAWDRPSALDYSPTLDGRPSARNRGTGGRRPGAGAPPANLNAYKHGRYSRQKKDLVKLLLVLRARLPTQYLPLLSRLLEDARAGEELRRLRVTIDRLRARLSELEATTVREEEFQNEAPAA